MSHSPLPTRYPSPLTRDPSRTAKGPIPHPLLPPSKRMAETELETHVALVAEAEVASQDA
jgi:hypothetical protein